MWGLRGGLAALVVMGFLATRGVDAAARANASPDVEKVIALELELSHLIARNDFDAYARHLAPGYTLTTVDGQLLGREAALAWWRAHGGYLMTPSQMHVSVYRDTAILTAHITGPEGGSGDRITKTFVRIRGRWMLAALHASHIAGKAL